ncbi:hypothetical protein HNQ80_001247 [Anaerosolibacter carboniphilus]|uniref:DUF4879 domain-containing protein n=1 Tax=Anaerosolibacter carboniphilus TaxID=1417629 RepID=A0A841KSN7_9FIRM|nr:DUF4879 domain-containing protein [Anaerosolibacter carboniphilus]MBB6215158.1 hypothetical protein [Anaerosolibacter carboniphilus]
MKKRGWSIMLSLIICLGMTMNVFGETLHYEKEDDTTNSLLLQKTSIDMDKQLRETLESLKAEQASHASEDGEFQLMAPAPPLTYLQVYAAISSKHPTYEYFSENQLSSIEDHGGDEMYIVTVELGYGHTQFAKMGNVLLNVVQSEAIDLDNDSIIDGWFYWWDASSYESGNFTYQNTSSNYPWNTMSDAIYIK